MQLSHQRSRDASLRMKDFVNNHPEIPATTIWPQCVTELDAVNADFDSHAAAEAAHDGAKLQGTDLRGGARRTLYEFMLQIVRTARAIAIDHPGFNRPFRMPENEGDGDLVDAALGMATAAAEPATKALFISHGMPADFVEELNENIDALQAAIKHQSSRLGDRKASGASIDETDNRANRVRRIMDAFVRNFYRDNLAVLAEWETASHIERGTRRKGGSEEPPKNEPGK